jgi:hypothetical protein
VAKVNNLFSGSQIDIAAIVMAIGLAMFVGLHIIWRIQPSKLASKDELEATLRDGVPTIIEVYTNL